MDKDIIIDGVNVAECKHFKYDGIKKPICRSGGCRGIYKNCLCEGNDDCDYKQLKRLQAENERLKRKKEIASEVAKDNSIFEDWYYELNEENEQLHNNIKLMTKYNNENIDDVIRYRKALEEIREIAENYFEECGVPDDYFKRNNYSWKQHQIKGLTCKLQQILDKINEVLNERN